MFFLYLAKLILIIGVFGLKYVWNRFVIKNLVKFVLGQNKKNNPSIAEKWPMENIIYYTFSAFYYFGALIISWSILFKMDFIK